MARPRKLTRDPDKKPRSFDELQTHYQNAERLYRLTGGESIDMQIAALDRTQDAYRSQMDAAEMMQSEKGVGAWGPTVNPYESRMTASTAAKLHKLKEQKMAQCLLWAEEGYEAELAKRTAAERIVPEVGDCPRASDEDQAESEREPTDTAAAAPIPMNGHAGPKGGDSFSVQTTRGGQPLLAGTNSEFHVGNRAERRRARARRRRDNGTD
jgi:hypothetical protein